MDDLEKIHEEMITRDDSLNTIDLSDYYAITPSNPVWNPQDLIKKYNGKWVEPGFEYNSGTNQKWLSPEKIRELVKQEVDPTFEV